MDGGLQGVFQDVGQLLGALIGELAGDDAAAAFNRVLDGGAELRSAVLSVSERFPGVVICWSPIRFEVMA